MTPELHLQLRRLPAVSALLATPAIGEILARHDRARVIRALQGVLAEARGRIYQGEAPPELEALVEQALAGLRQEANARLRRVVNATGVVLNTNLGRAPLSAAAIAQLTDVAAHYSNLEFDLATGHRGARDSHVEDLLCRLTGAEAALVVNNNAAAVLLVVDTFARGREVVISRGQLIEIGGSFRVPEVITASGARLVEVGTTNKTYLRDYERALGPETGMVLRCHPSNYRIVGFTHEVAASELAELGRAHGVLTVEDLGSGLLLDLTPFGLPPEPTVQASVMAGLDLVTFSGDKLLGGGQAGIVVGRREQVARLRQNPLLRALRQDKLTLAALEATLRAYLEPEAARQQLPVLEMLTRSEAELTEKARQLAARLALWGGARLQLTTHPGLSQVGGGSLPGVELPTCLVGLRSVAVDAQELAARLRRASVAIVARIEREWVWLDPRTLLPGDDAEIQAALAEALP